MYVVSQVFCYVMNRIFGYDVDDGRVVSSVI